MTRIVITYLVRMRAFQPIRGVRFRTESLAQLQAAVLEEMGAQYGALVVCILVLSTEWPVCSAESSRGERSAHTRYRGSKKKGRGSLVFSLSYYSHH